jgi:hypothetical protein
VTAPIRVVQWTTGIVGSAALRAIIDDPRLELVGVFAHSAAKVGTDAGALAGRPATGIVASDDIEALLAAAPECVVYMPQWPDIEELERFLRAGTNVVTTARLVDGTHYPDDAGARLAAAAAAGGATLYGTGMNPMFVPSVALAATGMCKTVRHLRILESVDCAMYGSAGTWEAYGFGTPPDRERLTREMWDAEPDYREALDVIAAGLGVTLDDHRLELDCAIAVGDRDLGFMTIADGTVSARDGRWIGLVQGDPFIELRTTWKLGGIYGHRDEPDFPMLYGYRIDIDGEPNVKVQLSFAPDDLEAFDIGVGTALPAINAIPSVCAAPAGVVTSRNLPIIASRRA